MSPPRPRVRVVLEAALGLGFLLARLAYAAPLSGDPFCDVKASTADTCVVAGAFSVPDDAVLTFTKPNLVLRGSLSVQFAGLCSLAPMATCASDADCLPARCLRTGRITLQVEGSLAVESRGAILARGQALAGDTVGPDGGTITASAHDLTVAGTLGASAAGATGIPAGRGGQIALHADGTATFAAGARLDASTSRGGCGGSIAVDGPLSLAAGGLFNADGATFGGTIQLAARDYLSASGTFQASNTNSDQAGRPPCGGSKGGGLIMLGASLVEFSGSAKGEGRQGPGGVVRFEGERGVTVDSGVGTTPIDVSGGDGLAFSTGGGVFLLASAGDVLVRRGAINADGVGTGLGSDAGAFKIAASGALRCEGSGAPCASEAACDAGEACVETGGRVLVQAPVSAAGGAGLGSGGLQCEIRGTGAVTVSAPIDVGGGRQRFAVGGKLTIAAGEDLTIGPGSISADGADGGDVLLIAGERANTARDVSGVLRILRGTRVWAGAFLDDGVGGHIEIEGCDVELESEALIQVNGGSLGSSDGIDAVAHDRLTIGPLASLSAVNGEITLAYRGEATIAPDAAFQPSPALVMDPTITACPACGNGLTEGLEDCDGQGTCSAPGDVCLPAGVPDQCSCRSTCGVVPGVQPGEECDGSDLGGITCVSLGFVGGTLVCRADCTLDASGCVDVRCGDGIVGPGEACDPGGIDGAPPSFGGATCATRGFPAGGTLACTPDCGALVTQPHCAANVTQACSTAADCAPSGACVAGCVQCGNGFVDGGEECDDGAENGNTGNRCRLDCRSPRCGDGALDFPHCAGDPAAECASPSDCPEGESCLGGEECDRGPASCAGGTNGGAPCCAAADCPGGECPGGDCRCDCTLPSPLPCDGCDDAESCTTDTCDPVDGCRHVPVSDGTACGVADACHAAASCRAGSCVAGALLDCDDGLFCTVDVCSGALGCRHERLGYDAVRGAVEASLVVAPCAGEKVPPLIGRLLGKARALIARAGGETDARKAKRRVRHAIRKLGVGLHTATRAERRGLPPGCATPLREVIADAQRRARCLLETP